MIEKENEFENFVFLIRVSATGNWKMIFMYGNFHWRSQMNLCYLNQN